jgi:hypothetical protein
MATSTGPIVTLGLITWANGAVIQPKAGQNTLAFSARVAVGTGIAAGGLSLVERASPELARGVAWVALVTALFTRIGGRRSPIDNLLRWWNEGER